MTHQPRLFDRSRVVADWDCKRKRYLGYEYGGKGLAGETLALELYMGIVIHDAMSAIARGFNIDEIAIAAQAQMLEALRGADTTGTDPETYAQEQAALVEGLIRGFYKHMWPKIQVQYKVILVEQEMLLPIVPVDKGIIGMENPDLGFMSKPDLLLDDANNDLWYLEYKSTSSVKDDWINSWTTAVQVHSSIKAAEHVLGRQVAGVIIQGLYKGYCLAPGTQVLTNDLRYVNAGDIKVGETLAGFEEIPQRLESGKTRTRQWKTATVTGTGRAQLPSYRLTFEDGTQVVCSDQHQWLTAWRTEGSGVAEWTTTEDLVPWSNNYEKGHRVLRIAPNRHDIGTTPISPREWGYLGGILDGEGHLAQTKTKSGYWLTHMAISQKPGLVLGTTVGLLAHAGIKHSVLGKGTTDVKTVMISDRRDIMRLLVGSNPVRLSGKFSFDKLGGMNNYERPVKLVSKEFLGIKEVVTLSTSTGTLVAEGLATHNSSYGKQNSPFCYGYMRPGNPPFSQEEWLHEYKAGFKRFPIWEREGGVKQWVEEMSDEQLAAQFPQTAPIFIKRDLVDAFFRQTETRELEIASAVEIINVTDEYGGSPESRQELLDTVFPQNFAKCQPGWGKPCPFRKICHGPPNVDPLKLGFTWRTPHHQPEVDQWQEAETQKT